MKKSAKNGQKRPKMAKNGKNLRFTGEKWFYVIGTFFWHILAKLKKNPQNVFFAKSQKPRNDVKFTSKVNIFCQKRPKFVFTGEKMVLCKERTINLDWLDFGFLIIKKNNETK